MVFNLAKMQFCNCKKNPLHRQYGLTPPMPHKTNDMAWEENFPREEKKRGCQAAKSVIPIKLYK